MRSAPVLTSQNTRARPRRRQEQPRWLDTYQHPGSYVHVRFMRAGDDAADVTFTATDLLGNNLDKVVENMSMQMAECVLRCACSPYSYSDGEVANRAVGFGTGAV